MTIPPDFEDQHRLALTLCQHLGIRPDQVELGSLTALILKAHGHTDQD